MNTYIINNRVLLDADSYGDAARAYLDAHPEENVAMVLHPVYTHVYPLVYRRGVAIPSTPSAPLDTYTLTDLFAPRPERVRRGCFDRDIDTPVALAYQYIRSRGEGVHHILVCHEGRRTVVRVAPGDDGLYLPPENTRTIRMRDPATGFAEDWVTDLDGEAVPGLFALSRELNTEADAVVERDGEPVVAPMVEPIRVSLDDETVLLPRVPGSERWSRREIVDAARQRQPDWAPECLRERLDEAVFVIDGVEYVETLVERDPATRALVKGWKRWDAGERPSQVYYRAASGRVACVEGDLRYAAAARTDRRTGEFPSPLGGGTYVNRRLAARLADWAGWGRESRERVELVKYVADGGEAKRKPFPEPEFMTAEEAYGFPMGNRDGNAADPIDGYRFCPYSCMEEESDHGATLDNIGGDALSVIVWHGLGRDIVRAIVWTDDRGNRWVEDIFNCPQVEAGRVAEWLAANGIRPVDDIDTEIDLGPAEFPVCIGYCDYLRLSSDMRWVVDGLRRRKPYPDSTEVAERYCCPGCESWFLDLDYEPYCTAECARDAGVDICAWCDGPGGGHGPRGEHCSDECAESAGHVMCPECHDWLARPGHGPNRDHCSPQCAEAAGYRLCPDCECWFDEDEIEGRCCCESGTEERERNENGNENETNE